MDIVCVHRVCAAPSYGNNDHRRHHPYPLSASSRGHQKSRGPPARPPLIASFLSPPLGEIDRHSSTGRPEKAVGSGEGRFRMRNKTAPGQQCEVLVVVGV
jgi:hypothetical protein